MATEEKEGILKDVFKSSFFQPSSAGINAKLFDMDRVWKILDGAIDVHIHSAPEAYSRRHPSDLTMACQACEVGMAAVVVKCHSVPTNRSAVLVQEAVDEWAKRHGKRKTDVFGGVTLNYGVGGLNPEAVVVNARLGGKYVWLPTLDSAYHRQGMGTTGGIQVLDDNGKVLPQLKEILKLIAEAGMTLCITHQSTKERFAILDEAKKLGVERIEIAHPNLRHYTLTIEEQKMAAAKGAYMGIYCMSLSKYFDEDYTLRIIKEVGPEHLVAGTDAGLYLHDIPVEAMRKLIAWMLQADIPDKDVERIAKINARQLLY